MEIPCWIWGILGFLRGCSTIWGLGTEDGVGIHPDLHPETSELPLPRHFQTGEFHTRFYQFLAQIKLGFSPPPPRASLGSALLQLELGFRVKSARN